MKLCVPMLALAALLVAALTPAPTRAAICTVDDVPAATLLLPYFEVDVDHSDGVSTLLSINNASASAALAHVVIWSDLSVPVLDFNVYLTGFDVQTINLRDVLVDGRLPATASTGQDPGDTISPRGAFSQDINYASCAGYLPFTQLPGYYVQHLQDALSGMASQLFGGRCAGREYHDWLLRGYVTVDVVAACSLEFPGDPGYFVSGGQGTARNANVLWGDYFYVLPRENYAQGETLVHIEADATNPATALPGNYTFYGRYVAWSAADNREPLATAFASRFVDGGAFDGGTDLIVWRDSKVAQAPFTCPSITGRPAWYPLAQAGITIFDEQENPEVVETLPISPPPPTQSFTPFPAEAQRTHVGGPDLPVTPIFGWLLLDLDTTVTAAGQVPPNGPDRAQAWVTTVMSAEGRFSVGFDAIQLGSACVTD